LGKNEFNGWSYINKLENVNTWPKNTKKAQLGRHYNLRYTKDSKWRKIIGLQYEKITPEF